MLLNILLTLFLVLLNGFFVAAEFAIVKVRISQIQIRSGQSFSARMAKTVVNNLDGYLAATQLGITLASLGLGWIGEGVVSKIILAIFHGLGLELDETVAHSIALPISFAFITILHIVFGELAPKTLAIRYPTQTTLSLSAPLRFFYIVFKPFIWMLNGLAAFLLKMIGIQPVQHSEIHSEEELKLIIAESAEGGGIQESERELIQNVFDFDNRLVRQVLKPRTQIVAIEINTPMKEAARQAVEDGYSRYPVYEGNIDHIKGFVLTKDLLNLLLNEPEKGLPDILRPVLIIPSGKKIFKVLRTFQKEHAQMAVVINEFGGTIGILTLEDILEELVGEIQDEYDEELPLVQEIGENTYLIQAQNALEEINEFLPQPLPLGVSYSTLSGLILDTLDKLPENGQELEAGHYKMKIVKMDKASPEVVEIQLLNPPAS